MAVSFPSWSTSQVVDLLTTHKLLAFVPRFKADRVDGGMLADLIMEVKSVAQHYPLSPSDDPYSHSPTP